MHIEKIELQNFRNYKNLELEFSKNVNLILGKNAQGKTNLLEAVYLTAIGRSFRTSKDLELVKFNENNAIVKVWAEKELNSTTVEISIKRKGEKSSEKFIKKDRKNVTKTSQLLKNILIVIFSPEDLKIVKDEPEKRRKFIDRELSQISPKYYNSLSNYKKSLLQRNTYLKSSQKIDDTFLSVLDDQLIDYGCRVIKHRIKFIKDLEKFGQKKHLEISNELEELSISYQSSVNFTNEEVLMDSFKMALEKSRSRDLFKKNTGVGPHRDDIAFYINGMDASFGSQGQHRSLVLSIKLAEIDLMESITNESPILLLDDVMSELDNTRQLKLLETISQSIQTFITTTSLDHLQNLPENLSIFNIQNGKISVNQN